MNQQENFAVALYRSEPYVLDILFLKAAKLQDIYVNLRQMLSHPQLLKLAAGLIAEKLKPMSFDLICGVPYTALPIATTVVFFMTNP